MAEASLEGLSADEISRLASISQQVLGNPATRTEALRLLRKVNPNVPLPELDLDERFAAQDKQRKDELAALEAKNTERDLAYARDRRKLSMMEAGTVKNTAEFEAVEKFAIDNKIGDYDKAAHFFQMSQQVATPTPGTITPMKLPINFEEIGKNPRQWAREEGVKVLNEVRSGKAA